MGACAVNFWFSMKLNCIYFWLGDGHILSFIILHLFSSSLLLPFGGHFLHCEKNQILWNVEVVLRRALGVSAEPPLECQFIIIIFWPSPLHLCSRRLKVDKVECEHYKQHIFLPIDTMLSPIKVNSNTIELIMNTSCDCVLDLLCYNL